MYHAHSFNARLQNEFIPTKCSGAHNWDMKLFKFNFSRKGVNTRKRLSFFFPKLSHSSLAFRSRLKRYSGASLCILFKSKKLRTFSTGNVTASAFPFTKVMIFSNPFSLTYKRNNKKCFLSVAKYCWIVKLGCKISRKLTVKCVVGNAAVVIYVVNN